MKYGRLCGNLLSIVVALVCHASEAVAGFAQAGYISDMSVSNGVVSFESSSPHVTPPPCQPEVNRRLWAFDGATAKGQVMLSVILSAQAQGKMVTIGGTSTCDPRGDVEGVIAVTVSQ